MALKDEPADVTDVTVKPAGTGGESLDDLAREADMLDAAPEAAAQEGERAEIAQQVQSESAELLGVLQAVRAMAFPILSMAVDERRMAALAQVWNDGVLGQSAAAGAAVMAKHGWSLNGAFDQFGPYVMLVAALAPPVMMTKKIMEPDPKPAAAKPADGQQQ